MEVDSWQRGDPLAVQADLHVLVKIACARAVPRAAGKATLCGLAA